MFNSYADKYVHQIYTLSPFRAILLLFLTVAIYIMAKTALLTKVNPTTAHPVCITILFVIVRPVSHAKCLSPLKLWNVNGSEIKYFVANLTATGHVANAAAMLALSKCQPNAGATRYAAPKT